MKPQTYNEILLAIKNDKSKVRDHICAKVNTLSKEMGTLSRIADAEKYNNMPIELSTAIMRRTALNLIVKTIKFYESL